MFCMNEVIATKMFVFVSEAHRKNKDSYVIGGPVKAAQKRNAKVIFVDYKQFDKIWEHVKQIVLDKKSNKRLRLVTDDGSAK